MDFWANCKNMKKIKNRKIEGEIIYGVHSIIEMLKAGRRKLISLYTTKPLPKNWDRLKRYLPKHVPNIQYVDRHKLSSIAGSAEHMGVVAFVTHFKYQKNIFESKKSPFILLLDSIQDVHNLGAILRSAYCTGVDGVVLLRKGSAPLSPAAIKASAGLSEHLNIYLAPSLKSAVIELKKCDYNLYMTVVGKGQNAMEIDYKKPLCLVIGNEATGISKDILKEGELVTLPERSGTESSFNASVAAGIFLFLISQKVS